MAEMISTKEKWEDWAIKLQAIAQAGLHYSDNAYEKERYEEVRQIACEILDSHCDNSIEQIKDIFCAEKGYQTPKMDSRAVCFKDDKILLVQENTGLWALPGGWVDVDQSISQNTIKEAMEEAGAVVAPKFVIALQDWKQHVDIKYKHLPFQICKVFMMCDLISVNFQPNIETLQCNFFDRNNLPELTIGKNSYDQIDMCFKAYSFDKQGKSWKTLFD